MKYFKKIIAGGIFTAFIGFSALLPSTLAAEQTDVNYTAGSWSEIALSHPSTYSKYASQGFTAGVDGTLTKVSINLKRTGSPSGNVFSYLYSDNGSGAPSSLLASGSSVSASSLSTSSSSVDFTFSYEITSGTKYHIVIYYYSTFSTSNFVIVTCDTSGGYSGGVAHRGSSAPPSTSLSYDFNRIVTTVDVVSGWTDISTWGGVSAENLSTINGVDVLNISSIGGVSTGL